MSSHTILLPNGEWASSSTVLPVGAASRVLAVSDASDASYAHGTGTAATQSTTFKVQAITIAANQRVKTLHTYVRTARDAAGGSTQDTSTTLAIWPKLTVKSVSQLNARASTTILTSNGPLTQTAPGLTTEWTQALINSIAMQITWSQPHTGTKNVFQRVYEMGVDVEIITQAVVTGAPVVTNFTNNAKPTVSWVFNDPDGEEQIAFRAKIFDAATVATGNFDPETSTAVWDTDTQLGTSSSADVSTQLKNGTTYTAYVKVAKYGPNVGVHGIGTLAPFWWSPWAASAAFTVTFSQPATPQLLSVSVLADDSSYRASLSALMPINLLFTDAASFETSTGNWTSFQNCTVLRDTAQFCDGIASLKLTSSAPTTNMQARSAIDFIGEPRVDPGQTYTALASFKAATVGRSCAVGVQWMDLAGTTILSTVFGANITDTTVGCTQATFTGTAPTGAGHARVIVQVAAPAASGEVHWVDKVDIHAGTGTTWTPGGFGSDQGGVTIERGEFVDDTRGPAYNWFEPQVASCGAVQRNPGSGFFYDSTVSTLEWMWLDKTLGRPGYVSSGMLRWTVYSGVFGAISFGRDFYGRILYYVPALPSQNHTFSIWSWVDTGTRVVKGGIDYRDEAGNLQSRILGNNVTLTTTPQLISVTSLAPTGTALANGVIADQSSAAQQHVYFTTCGFGIGTNSVDQFEPLGLPNTPVYREINYIGVDNSLDFLNFPAGFSSGQREGFSDYEYPAARPVFYRAWIAYSFSGFTLRSANSPVSLLYGAPPARTILRSVTDNTLGVVINRRKTMNYTLSEDAQIYHPLGADGAPVKVRDWVSGEDGTFELIIATEAQYQRLRRILTANGVLEVQWAQGGRSYVIITATSMQETLSEDVTWCDANGDGLQDHIRYVIVSLSYMETLNQQPVVGT